MLLISQLSQTNQLEIKSDSLAAASPSSPHPPLFVFLFLSAFVYHAHLQPHLQLLLDAKANVEGSLQDGMENYTETPLQLAAAAGTETQQDHRLPSPVQLYCTMLSAAPDHLYSANNST